MDNLQYQIEQQWEMENKLISLLLVTESKTDHELINICDQINNRYISDFEEVMLHFFYNSDSVTDYLYFGLVEMQDEEIEVK